MTVTLKPTGYTHVQISNGALKGYVPVKVWEEVEAFQKTVNSPKTMRFTLVTALPQRGQPVDWVHCIAGDASPADLDSVIRPRVWQLYTVAYNSLEEVAMLEAALTKGSPYSQP